VLSLVWTALLALAVVVGWLVLAGDLDQAAGAAGFRLSGGPGLSGLPHVLAGLLTAGALAALLAGAHAALFSAAGALSLDIWDAAIDRRGPAGRRLAVARILVMAVAAGAAWLAVRSPAPPAILLAWALALVAAGSFAPLLIGLWWRRCNAAGALLGTAAGSALVLVASAADLGIAPSWMRLPPASAGGTGLAAAFVVAIVASLTGRAPAPESQALVDELRGGGERPPIRERPA
jgi:cation/acetate symporter